MTRSLSTSRALSSARSAGAPRQRGRGVLSSLAVAGLLATALAPSPSTAAAYYVGEIGARSIARGGANLVNPGDPSAMWSNPAAVTLVTGPQLQLDLNLVWLQSEFVRNCGGEANGCAINTTIDREYADPKTGKIDPARAFFIEGGKRQVGARDSSGAEVAPAEPGRLGNLNQPSRFDGDTALRNEANVQPIPRLFATFNSDTFGIDGFAGGVYVYAPSAGDYKFSENGPGRYTLIDRDILEVFYGLTLGYRYKHWFAVGASLQGVTSGLDQTIRLTADTVGNEDENFDVQVRIQGTQHLIPSGNIGVWSNPLKDLGIGDLELAGSVQLPRLVQASGPIKIQKFGATLQSDFIDSGLATINDEGATATAEFTLPPIYRVGAKYGIDNVFNDDAKTLGFNVEADFVYEAWSTYDHVFLTTQGLTFSTGGGEPEPLPPIVQPKDWLDAWSVRLGGSVALWDKLLEVHGGGFYETGATPNTTHSIELVDGDKVGLGTGISSTWNGIRLDVAYQHVFVFDRVIGDESIVTAGNVVVPPPVGAEGELRTRVAMGEYKAGYDMLNVGLTVAFDDLFNFGVHTPEASPGASDVDVDDPTPSTPAGSEASGPGSAPVVDEAPAADTAGEDGEDAESAGGDNDVAPETEGTSDGEDEEEDVPSVA